MSVWSYLHHNGNHWLFVCIKKSAGDCSPTLKSIKPKEIAEADKETVTIQLRLKTAVTTDTDMRTINDDKNYICLVDESAYSMPLYPLKSSGFRGITR